jgi:hypothetical protein
VRRTLLAALPVAETVDCPEQDVAVTEPTVRLGRVAKLVCAVRPGTSWHGERLAQNEPFREGRPAVANRPACGSR